jgi:hypothetical protein
MALERNCTEIVNEAGMDFGDQLTGRVGERMADSMLELI